MSKGIVPEFGDVAVAADRFEAARNPPPIRSAIDGASGWMPPTSMIGDALLLIREATKA